MKLVRKRSWHYDDGGMTEEVKIPVGEEVIFGNLSVPRGSKGVVLFAHGSGSGRFSPRNNAVAAVLQKKGIATLLVDLLTKEEEAVDELTREHRFNIGLLAERLLKASEGLKKKKETKGLALGYYGSSTGAAAALVAAAQRKDVVSVVSRGGRTDLAGEFLPKVKAACLFIMGSLDEDVLRLNEESLEALRCKKKLEIVGGASHLFEEPGTLEKVTELASAWFLEHFLARLK